MSAIPIIVENGEEMKVSQSQYDKLVEANLIYLCSDCHAAHISDEMTFEDVEKFLARA